MSDQPRSNAEWGTSLSALTAEPSPSISYPGWQSDTEPSPHWMNWWMRLMHFYPYVFQDGLDDMAGNYAQSVQVWGPGIDGDVSITGAVTLSRDMFYENLTFEAGGSIEVHGNRIFVRDTMDMSRAASAAVWSDPSGYASTTYGVLGDPLDPGAAGAQAAAATGTLGGASGGAGGNGGGENAGTSSATGYGNNGGAQRVAGAVVFNSMEPGLSPVAQIFGGMGGSGGGAGGPSSGGGAGGRGGGGGGAIWISAKRLRRELGGTAQRAIRAAGEDGVDGADAPSIHKGGGGGGGGGAGGFVFLRTHTLLGTGCVDMIDVSGGDGGDGGDGLGNFYSSVGGNGGSAGAVFYWDVSTETFTALTGGAGATASQTGGAGAELLGDL